MALFSVRVLVLFINKSMEKRKDSDSQNLDSLIPKCEKKHSDKQCRKTYDAEK